MPESSYDLDGTRVLECAREGRLDAVEIIGDALGRGARVVVIPEERLGDDFFRLRTGVAGAFLQKFVTYGVRIAIVGDIARYQEASPALRDFVYESNRGHDIRFVSTLEEVRSWLSQLAAQ